MFTLLQSIIILRAVPVVVLKRLVAATPSTWRAASTMCRASCVLGDHSCCRSFSVARNPSARKISNVLSGDLSPCCTWLTCVKLVRPCALSPD